MPQGNRKCERCDFYGNNGLFIPIDERRIIPIGTLYHQEAYIEGVCYRYPEKKLVNADNWCGEFVDPFKDIL